MQTGTSIAQFHDMMKIVPRNQAILLEGDTGIGKTSITRGFADSIKLPLALIQVNEGTDMVDVFGLPDLSGDRTICKPPSWYLGPDTPCVLLMDEVNRNRNIMKGLMRLATDQRIGDLVLAPGSYVFGAINPEYGSLYQVVEMDPAHRARFLLIELAPTVPEWLGFARDEGVHPKIIAYIKDHPEDLDTFSNEDNLTEAKGKMYHNVLPCRRQWHHLSPMLYNGEDFDSTGKNRFSMDEFPDGREFLDMTVRGMVGNGCAERFVKFYYRSGGCGITPRILLEGTRDEWKPGGEIVNTLKKMAGEDIPSLVALAEGIGLILNKEEDTLWNVLHDAPNDKAKGYAENLYKFLFMCPPEVVSSFYYNCVSPSLAKGKKWGNLMGVACSKICDIFDKVLLSGKNSLNTGRKACQFQ